MHSYSKMLSMPPATNGYSPQRSLGKFSSFTPALAYVFLIVFIVLFFFIVGLVLFYIQKHCSWSNSEAVDNHGQSTSDSTALRSLTVVTVVAETTGECAICLEEVREGEEVKIIPYCKHIFHANCIDRWLENQVTCPVCRYSERSRVEEFVTVGGEDAEVSVTNLE